MCEKCGERPAQMGLHRVTDMETLASKVCLHCYHDAITPRFVPPPPPVLQPDASAEVFSTLDEANARAEKVRFYLGTLPDIAGSNGAYWLRFDSPLVPGYAGRNPYKR